MLSCRKRDDRRESVNRTRNVVDARGLASPPAVLYSAVRRLVALLAVRLAAWALAMNGGLQEFNGGITHTPLHTHTHKYIIIIIIIEYIPFYPVFIGVFVDFHFNGQH